MRTSLGTSSVVLLLGAGPLGAGRRPGQCQSFGGGAKFRRSLIGAGRRKVCALQPTGVRTASRLPRGPARNKAPLVMKRTHLPLNALRVFDAAARHLSFTRAADELAVTPAAVGQQIRALEDVLGVVLFRRTSKGLELTDEGEAGLDPLREGFLRFEESVQAMQAGQASRLLHHRRPARILRPMAGPAARRLPQAANPEVRFQHRRRRGSRFHRGQSRPRDAAGRRAGRARGRAARPGAAASSSPRRARPSWIDWPGAPLPEGAEPCIQAGNAGQALASAHRRARPHHAAAAAGRGGDRPTGSSKCWKGRRTAAAPTGSSPRARNGAQKKVRALVDYLSGE